MASELNLYSEQCTKAESACKIYTYVAFLLTLNEHKMKSSKRCLRQVRINMICLTSESIQKQSTHSSVKRRPGLLYIYTHEFMLKGTSANAGPHYQKLYARVTHIRGNRRSQPSRSAMKGPHPERTS